MQRTAQAQFDERAGSGRIYRGCLFCMGGMEKKVVRTLAVLYPSLRAIAPERLRIRREQGKVFEERVLLLPGYVFFESHEPELSMKLSRQEHVLRLLTYPDGTWHLRGYDDAFARMLFRENGEIGFSQAVFDEGDRIHILSGFLKDYEGAITRVNRRYRTVEVSLELQGKKVSMWLGYELVKKADEEEN